MKYLLPQDIANELWISLKTVYNYISKWWSKIRRDKRNWKTFVNFEDLQNYLQIWLQDLQSDFKREEMKSDDATVDVIRVNWFWSVQNDYNTLQSEDVYFSEKVEQLQKANTKLQDLAQNYAIRLSEEKDEKKSLQDKYDNLEKNYFAKLDDYTSLQVNSIRKIYVTYFFAAILFTILMFLLLLYYNKLYLF